MFPNINEGRSTINIDYGTTKPHVMKFCNKEYKFVCMDDIQLFLRKLLQ